MTRSVRGVRRMDPRDGWVEPGRYDDPDAAPADAAVEAVDRDRPSLRALADGLAGLRADPRLSSVGLPIAVFAAVFLLRVLFIDRAYDIFTDEVTYLGISRNVASGQGVSLYGNPFFLHPPLFFVIEGIFVRLLNPSGLLIDQVQAIRVLNALLAAVTGLAILALVNRLAGRLAAIAAIALFALDPFIIRINSRNLIETSAFLWIALGYVLLISAIPARRGDFVPRQAVRVAGAGALFGLGLLSKEMTFFLSVVPLGLAFVLGMSLPRRLSLAAIVAAFLTYAIYPVTVFASGFGPLFVEDKFSGLLRFVGVVKTTGFVPGGPSFAAAVTKNLDIFATTYLLIAIGIPAFIVLLVWGDPRRRLLGLLGGSAYALLAYSIKFGTLEEQFFYYLVLPALLTVTTAWWLVVEEMGLRLQPAGWPAALQSRVGGALERAKLRRAWDARPQIEEGVRLVAPVVLAVTLLWSTLIWFEVHLTPDNGYERLLSYMRANVPHGAPIGVTSDPQQFVLQGYVIRQVNTTRPLTAGNVRYVAISTKQIEDGYVQDGNAILAWLRANAQPVFAFNDRSYGTIELFRLTPPLAVAGSPTAAAPPPPPLAIVRAFGDGTVRQMGEAP